MDTSPSRSSSIETLTLLGRLRGTKGLPLFVACVLVAVGISARQASFVREELSAPDVGLVPGPTRDGRALLMPSARWPEVHAGDELVAVNGAALGFADWERVRHALQPGPVRVTVKRDDLVLELTGTVATASPAYGFALVIRLMTGLILFLFGLGAFLLRPGGLTSWLFLLLMLGVGALAMLTGGSAGFVPRLYVLIVIALALTPALGLHLFALFPEPLPLGPRWLRALALVHVPGVVFVAFTAVEWAQTGVAVAMGQTRTLGLELAVRLWSIVCILGVVGIVLWQWRRHVRAKQARLAAQYRVLVTGILVGLLVPSVTVTIARALDTAILLGQASVGFILFFALALGVVLVRHNPLEVDRYAASVVGYVLALGLLGGVFGLALVGLPLVVNRLGLASSSEALVALTAVTFLSVGPAYRRLRRVVDRWFSREQADALRTAELLRGVVDAVQQQPREKALEVVLDAAQVLGGEQVALWEVDATGRVFVQTRVRGEGNPTAVPREGAFARALERPAGVTGLAPVAADAAVQQALWAVGLAMSAPVRAHGVAVAVLGVGRRSSGFGYRPEDLAFLETLAAQAGLAMERGQVVTQIGRYRVEKRLAAGGMAEIFIAWQLGLGGFERKVALKRLLPELAEDPRYAAGLLDEARIVARLHHRNIAQTFEVGLEQGQHFIVMEYVDGPPLRALLAAMKREGELAPVPIALAIARALLSALHHAHEVTDAAGQSLGVVHRDVTPANVLVAKSGEPKLVDFGLVMANSRLFRTETGIARGTLPYMSPEQAAGLAVDRRSDVYSAGATLYELFAGLRAFPEGPMGPRLIPPSQVRPELAELARSLDEVFARATAQEVEARWASAEAFLTALEGAVGVAPASEADVGAWVRRWTREEVAPAPVSDERTATVSRIAR